MNCNRQFIRISISVSIQDVLYTLSKCAIKELDEKQLLLPHHLAAERTTLTANILQNITVCYKLSVSHKLLFHIMSVI